MEGAPKEGTTPTAWRQMGPRSWVQERAPCQTQCLTDPEREATVTPQTLWTRRLRLRVPEGTQGHWPAVDVAGVTTALSLLRSQRSGHHRL